MIVEHVGEGTVQHVEHRSDHDHRDQDPGEDDDAHPAERARRSTPSASLRRRAARKARVERQHAHVAEDGGVAEAERLRYSAHAVRTGRAPPRSRRAPRSRSPARRRRRPRSTTTLGVDGGFSAELPNASFIACSISGVMTAKRRSSKPLLRGVGRHVGGVEVGLHAQGEEHRVVHLRPPPPAGCRRAASGSWRTRWRSSRRTPGVPARLSTVNCSPSTSESCAVAQALLASGRGPNRSCPGWSIRIPPARTPEPARRRQRATPAGARSSHQTARGNRVWAWTDRTSDTTSDLGRRPYESLTSCRRLGPHHVAGDLRPQAWPGPSRVRCLSGTRSPRCPTADRP